MLNSPLFSKHSQSGHLWYYITHCAAFAGLTGHHVAPLVNRYIPPNHDIRKQRIFPEEAGILSMHLCPQTLFTSHQKVLLGRFYLSVRICYGLLYKPVTGFESIF